MKNTLSVPFGSSVADLLPLVARTRGDGVLECLHFGALAHVNAVGQLISHAGRAANARWPSFTRSTIKIFQALPFARAGGLDRFGLNPRQTALLCASHNGEDSHVAEVQGMLDGARLTKAHLLCGCHVPALYNSGGRKEPEQLSFDERHNNCSGKHAGMLAHCVQSGWDTADYVNPSHPLQQAIAASVAQTCGLTAAELPRGTDGCSAPNWAMPMHNLAWGFARAASAAAGSAVADLSDATQAALARLAKAMVAEPYMVGGEGRNDTAFMHIGAGDWICKIGADGVQVVASISRAEAIAIKVVDADKPALFAATVAALDQLGWVSDAQRQALAVWREARLINVRGLAVGTREAVFELTTA
jgi:L-asparaginase II